MLLKHVTTWHTRLPFDTVLQILEELVGPAETAFQADAALQE